MSDMAYIMETQDPRELWLVDGENKFKVSREMYWLLVSQGADLPQAHDIADLLAENTKLRKLLVDAHACKKNDGCCEDCYADEGGCPIELRMRELRVSE